MILDSIENFKPKFNWILIKPDWNGQEITRPYEVTGPDGKLSIQIDTSYEPEKNACCTGTVVKIPEGQPYFNPSDPTKSMEWVTDFEVQEGDKVIFGYFAFTEAFRDADPRWIKVNGEIYILVFYGLMYLARRGDDVIMLNGYTLIEPVQDEVATKLFLPSHIKRSTNKQRGIVRYMGSLNREYSNHRYTPDDDSLQVGDLVTMDRYCNIPLEYSMWSTFDKNKTYFRVQRTFISGIIKQFEDGK